MFNYMQFNHYSKSDTDDVAKAVWEYLLTNHTNIPNDDFGSLVKELLQTLKNRSNSRIMLE